MALAFFSVSGMMDAEQNNGGDRMKNTLICVDLDGTLFDTEAVNAAVMWLRWRRPATAR